METLSGRATRGHRTRTGRPTPMIDPDTLQTDLDRLTDDGNPNENDD